MSEYIERREHDEFCKRMEEEHERINKRVSILEETVAEIRNLSISVKELACNMHHMLTEQQSQGVRLASLEKKDSNNWDKFKWLIVTALVSGTVGYLLNHLL